MLFKYKLARLEPKLPTTSFIQFSHSRPHCTFPNHPGPGTRQPGKGPMLQSPLKLFKLADPKSAYSALPVSSCRNHNKCSCPHLSPLPLAPGQPWCFPRCSRHTTTMAWYAPSSSEQDNKLSFQQQLYPDLFSLLYLNNNKTY